MSTPTTGSAGSSGYVARPLVEGFPGKSSSHGAFGWSSLWLLDDGVRRVLIDAGQPAYIPLIHAGLERLGLTTDDVTDVLLTHMHWDHVSNFPMFAHATTWVGEKELRWAADQPAGTPFIPTCTCRSSSVAPTVSSAWPQGRRCFRAFTRSTAPGTPRTTSRSTSTVPRRSACSRATR